MPDYTENWKYEQASNIYAYPSANASDKGDVNSEDNIAGITRHLTQKNFIIRYDKNTEPMKLGINSTSGDITVAKGSCIINGYYIELNEGVDAPISDFVDLSTVPDSNLHVVFKLIKDTTGNIRGDYAEITSGGVKSICHGVAWSVLTNDQLDDLKNTDTPYLEVGYFNIVNHSINSIVIPKNIYAYIDLDKIFVGDTSLEDLIGNATDIMAKVEELDTEINNPSEGLKPKMDSLLSKDYDDSRSLLNLIYPVGSIYMSVNNTSPSVLFGGRWEQIEDRFLLAAGSTYVANQTGGSASAKLLKHTHPATSSATVPYHTHHLNDHDHQNADTDLFWAASGTWTQTKRLAPASSESSARHYLISNSDSKTRVKLDGDTGGVAGVNPAIPITTTITQSGTENAVNTANMPPYLTVYMWKRLSDDA